MMFYSLEVSYGIPSNPFLIGEGLGRMNLSSDVYHWIRPFLLTLRNASCTFFMFDLCATRPLPPVIETGRAGARTGTGTGLT